jgi:hypothetical protein
MKSGRSLIELATELERQKAVKSDLIVDTRATSIVEGEGGFRLNIDGFSAGDGSGGFPLTHHAERQIVQHVGVPVQFYDRLSLKHPDMATDMVTKLLQREPSQRMIRTLDNRARAFLSNRYRRMDNGDLAEAVLPVLNEVQGMRIESCELTERRMYLKVVTPRLETEVKKGDVVQSGILIQNSEIGVGMLSVTPIIFRLVCLNGMVVNDGAHKSRHVGRNVGNTESVSEIFSDETLAADDKALWLKVRDTVRAALRDETRFHRAVNRLRDALGERIEQDPVQAVRVLSDTHGLNETESGSILRHLIEGADLSRYGMVNAITRAAQDVESYDRSTELEVLGGKVLDLPRSEWKVLAEAA